MKKIVILLIVVSSFMSCNMMMDLYYQSELLHNGYYYNDSFMGYTEPEEISEFLRDNLTTYNFDYVPALKDMWENGQASCVGYSLFYLVVVYVNTGIKGNLLVVANGNHCIVEINGIQIESRTGNTTHYDVDYRYNFDDVFIMD